MSEMSVSRKYRKRSRAAEIWRNFRKNKGAMLGLFILCIIFVIALTIEFWIDKDLVIGQHVAQRLKPPSWAHPFGTDDKGREMLWRVLYASRYSIAIGFVAVIVSLLVGVPLGAVAGYYGGRTETLIMRVADVFSATFRRTVDVLSALVSTYSIQSTPLFTSNATFASTFTSTSPPP